ncbi:phage integrase N-terminal SAM-like domain-containing protein [Allokutzneria sp. A3M-2-11 16]|uniref:phage integrase N-terminal SAM-like domain-containing protein n=1 Tax=Allokutzneria sp. A3M-2-11 16 TaxID=2962043 RepID=UPI0020B63A9C|nr:phage integrase N-terminal SAM-like domain-containing protein [Allokutzneria sp. A3M-2-11 16]MCP3799723.1 phage integrase N-terminal SAM-like domain-containing protein [Allokutzneria sp. A3M-2-11 16]
MNAKNSSAPGEWGKLVTGWRGYLQFSHTASTINVYLSVANRLGAWAHRRGESPTAIEPSTIQTYLDELRVEKNPATARLHDSVLRAFFRWAVDIGEVASSPMDERDVTPDVIRAKLRTLMSEVPKALDHKLRRNTSWLTGEPKSQGNDEVGR